MHFKLLQTAFTSACSCGLNRSNPICGVQLPRVERNIPRPYSASEQQKLLEELNETDLHLPVLLALLYGMRIGEICGLCWEDIDWEKKRLHVRHNAKRVHDESGRCRMICSDKLKTQSSFRSFPLHPEVEQLLRQRQPRRLAGPILTARYGLPLHPECLRRQFRLFLKEHDLRHIRFHDLRHTCATLLLHEGCSLREIQSYLGHASYLTTTRYAHIDARSKEHALEIMSAVLNVDKDN